MVARFYGTFEQFFDDLDLMCANAFTYNEDDSEVFRDAQQIKVGPHPPHPLTTRTSPTDNATPSETV